MPTLIPYLQLRYTRYTEQKPAMSSSHNFSRRPLSLPNITSHDITSHEQKEKAASRKAPLFAASGTGDPRGPLLAPLSAEKTHNSTAAPFPPPHDPRPQHMEKAAGFASPGLVIDRYFRCVSRWSRGSAHCPVAIVCTALRALMSAGMCDYPRLCGLGGCAAFVVRIVGLAVPLRTAL